MIFHVSANAGTFCSSSHSRFSPVPLRSSIPPPTLVFSFIVDRPYLFALLWVLVPSGTISQVLAFGIMAGQLAIVQTRWSQEDPICSNCPMATANCMVPIDLLPPPTETSVALFIGCSRTGSAGSFPSFGATFTVCRSYSLHSS